MLRAPIRSTHMGMYLASIISQHLDILHQSQKKMKMLDQSDFKSRIFFLTSCMILANLADSFNPRAYLERRVCLLSHTFTEISLLFSINIRLKNKLSQVMGPRLSKRCSFIEAIRGGFTGVFPNKWRQA